MIPFSITFRDFPESDSLWMAIQSRIQRLEHFFDHIIRSDIVISSPHRHSHREPTYHVIVRVKIPGQEIVINKDHHDDKAHRDAYLAIRDAFDAADRVLEEKTRIIKGMVKHHEKPNRQSVG